MSALKKEPLKDSVVHSEEVHATNIIAHPRVQTAEGWKRSHVKKEKSLKSARKS